MTNKERIEKLEQEVAVLKRELELLRLQQTVTYPVAIPVPCYPPSKPSPWELPWGGQDWTVTGWTGDPAPYTTII